MLDDFMRIASLLPSATEIVCALGARAELVGISHECDYPVGVGLGLGAQEPVPVLTRPRVLGRTSREIDRDVAEVLRQTLPRSGNQTFCFLGITVDPAPGCRTANALIPIGRCVDRFRFWPAGCCVVEVDPCHGGTKG